MDTKERLPDFPGGEVDVARLRELVAVIDRRLRGLGDSIQELESTESDSNWMDWAL